MEKQTYAQIAVFLTVCIAMIGFLWAVIKPVQPLQVPADVVEIAVIEKAAAVVVEDEEPKFDRITGLSLPFNGEWYVLNGGLTPEENTHLSIRDMHAVDFVKVENKQFHKRDGKHNLDYYCFDQEIVAPCDGTIIEVVTGYLDNIPNSGYDYADTYNSGGNMVILKMNSDPSVVITLAHLRHDSITAKEGQSVKKGDILGHCGNSGTGSPFPHLHVDASYICSEADKEKTVPMYFENILVHGQAAKSATVPVTHDRVQNAR
jgi:hypothetical protein